MIRSAHRSSCKVPVTLSDFNETLKFLDKVRKNIQIQNLMKIRTVGAELFRADRRTDMTKLIVTFRNFCPILMKLKFLDKVRKNTQIQNLMKIRTVGAELFRADRRTNGHDEVDGDFSQFCQRS